jgi:hypothetical protein
MGLSQTLAEGDVGEQQGKAAEADDEHDHIQHG